MKEVRPSSGELFNSPELQGENMSKIVSTDGACVLSRYMAAMAVAIRSTMDSPRNKDARTGVGGAEKTQNRQPLKRKILQLTLVACAAVYVGQRSIQERGR